MPPFQTLVPTPPVQSELPMQPNPNQNNKASQSIDILTTFQAYVITPIRLNEIKIWSGKVIKPNLSHIINKDECETSREGTVDLEATVTPIKTDIEWTITLVIANPRRIVTLVTTILSKPGTLVAADLDVITQDPSYPQRLIETGMTSQSESDFHREL